MVGGPQTPGILIAKKRLWNDFGCKTPTEPGGGKELRIEN